MTDMFVEQPLALHGSAKKVFHSMKVNKADAIEAQNTWCNMCDMKHLKEKIDIGDKYELYNTAARTLMKKV